MDQIPEIYGHMKLYLAGIEDHLKKAEELGVRYGLISFYYKKKLDWKPTFDIMLDSGAFTFMENKGKTRNIGAYLDKYIQFIKENDIDKFFELDIDSVVGTEEVRKYRRKLENETGKKCIPVWHKCRGKDAFIRLVEKYDYVSLGGIVSGEFSDGDYKFFPWFIREAHKRGTKIHGLGLTRLTALDKYNFDSVDSTNWNTTRYNTYYVFTGRGLKPQYKNRNGFKKRVKQGGREEYNRFQMKEWVKFQKHLDNGST